MYCLHCGASVPDRQVCPQCGADFPAELAGKASRPAPAAVRSATAVVGPAPRQPPSLLMLEHAPNAMFLLLFGGIFGSIGTVLGGVFGLVGWASQQIAFMATGAGVLLIGGGVGWTVFGFGVRSVRRTRRIWQHGDVATGEVTEARIDRNLRVNGRNPVLVQFRYRTYSGEFVGRGHSWNRGVAHLPAGTAVTVLVDPNDPARAIWVPPAGA